MRRSCFGTMAFLAIACVAPRFADSDEDSSLGRVREMLHRTQEALRQAQSENADLTRAKAESEQKLQTATKALESARGASKAEIALRGQLKSSESAQADLAQKLAASTSALTDARAKQSETEKLLYAKELAFAGASKELEHSKSDNASCEAKNLTLYGYADSLLNQYKNKGVWASLAQKEPVLGFKQVEIENVVQEYQSKMASQKVKP